MKRKFEEGCFRAWLGPVRNRYSSSNVILPWVYGALAVWGLILLNVC